MPIDIIRISTILLVALTASLLAGTMHVVSREEATTFQVFLQGATSLIILGFFFHWFSTLIKMPINSSNRDRWLHIAGINAVIIGTMAIFTLLSVFIIRQAEGGVFPVVASAAFLILLMSGTVWVLIWKFTLLHKEVGNIEKEI